MNLMTWRAFLVPGPSVPSSTLGLRSRGLMSQPSCRSWTGNDRFLGRFHNARQADREGRSAAGLARDRDVAPHHLTEAPTDRETEAGAAELARCGGGGLRKLLKQLAHLLRRHADPSVRNGDRDPLTAVVALWLRGDGHGAFLGEL